MHRRFGHYGTEALRHLHEVASGVKKITIPPKEKRICKACKIGKMRRKKSKRLATHKGVALELVSLDIAGPFIKSIRGFEYFLQIIDNYTRKVWTIPLKTKDEAIPKLQQWKLKEERRTKKKVIACRSDNAPELKEVMDQWERKDGVTAQYTIVASSHQNGPAERAIQTTENAIRAMTHAAGCPAEFWCFAAETDAHIRNRLARGPKIEGRRTSPEEAYTGEKQISDHLKVWGCVCYVHVDPKTIPAKHLHNKQADRGREAVFLGYSRDTEKQYWFYSADLGYPQRSSSVEFDESKKGGLLDLRLRNLSSNVTGQGTQTGLLDRKPRGRPKIIEETPSQDPELSKGNTTPTVEIPYMKPLKNIPSYPEEIMQDQENSANEKTPSITKQIPVEQGEEINTITLETPKTDFNLDPPIRKSTVEKELNIDPMELDTEDSNPAGLYIPIMGNRFQKDEVKAIEEALQEDTPRYSLRSNKRATTDEEQRDAKRIRTMIALLCHEPEEDDKPGIPEFTPSTMIQPLIYGKEIQKGIFERFYALLCRVPDQPEDYALPMKEIQGIKIPRTYKEAMSSPHSKEWDEAVRVEIEQLILNGTWEECILPKGANLVSTKWVFTIKETPKGNIDRFKARLVARGFSQSYGIDYSETFAPTVRMDTLRIFLAMVAKRNLECSQFDIKNAFTESRLKEDIFLAPPEGVVVSNGKVLKALRSLYGLKQAGRDWNLLLKDYLTTTCKFIQSLADPCLFIHKERKLYLLVYVDDIAAAAENAEQIKWFDQMLSRRFNTKNLGEIAKILGVRITRDRKHKTIYLDQEQYLEKVLTNFGITHGKARKKTTPIADYTSLQPTIETDEKFNVTLYQQMIGSLMYAMTLTRPDIAFALGYLARYMSNPAIRHGQAVKELMRYLRTTIQQKLRFGPGGGNYHDHFIIYTDADWANDRIDRKSVSGGVGLFYGGPFCWMSKKQRSVAKSSCESEYIAQAAYAMQGQWTAQVFTDLGMPEYIAPNHRTVDMRGDNQGAIALTKNPHLHERSKHIDVCYHYIRDLAEKGKLMIEYIPTTDMPADGLTKPLARTAFERFRSQLGVATD